MRYLYRAIARTIFTSVFTPVWIILGGEWYGRYLDRFFKNDPRLIIMKDPYIGRSEGSNLLLEVHGRTGGIIPSLLHALGFAKEVTLSITDKEVRFDTIRLFKTDIDNRIVPLKNITTTDLRIRKSVWWLYLACILIIVQVGLFLFEYTLEATFFTFLPAAAIGAYFWSSEIVIGFSSDNIDERYGLIFQRHNLISELFQRRNTLPYTEFLEVFDEINRNVVAAHLAVREQER